jgi:hypothetical protein
MNPNASPEEMRVAAEAAATPSMLDEKKFLEERRRRLETSLQNHVEELKDRGRQAGQVALVGAGALLGVWLVAKAVGSLAGSRKHKKARALKSHVKMAALGPDAAQPESAGHTKREQPQAATSFSSPPPPPRAQEPQQPAGPPEPSLFQTFMESEAGRMMTNQLVALLMVFVTRKLESVLQIERNADIGSVKESDLTPYRIVDPVSDAIVVPDSADAPADRTRSNAAPEPPLASA